jgi:hypothetical protein
VLKTKWYVLLIKASAIETISAPFQGTGAIPPEETFQYRQCAEDWRHYNSTIWQLPSITVTIASFLFGIAYKFLHLPSHRAIILFFGAALSTSLTISLIKHRLFMNESTSILKRMEENWKSKNPNINLIKRQTSEIIKDKERKYEIGWYDNLVAYNWLLGSMVLISALLGVLCIVNILKVMNIISIN